MIAQEGWTTAVGAYTNKKDGFVTDGLRPMGMLGTTFFTPDSTVSNDALLMRYYANELGYTCQDIEIAAAKDDRGAAIEAWRGGRDAINSWVGYVNRALPDKVGDKFVEEG